MKPGYTMPLRSGKVVRWMQHLSEAQLVELAARLSRCLTEVHDIDPERIRQTLITFAEHLPPDARS